jgi:hypothetical protein
MNLAASRNISIRSPTRKPKPHHSIAVAPRSNSRLRLGLRRLIRKNYTTQNTQPIRLRLTSHSTPHQQAACCCPLDYTQPTGGTANPSRVTAKPFSLSPPSMIFPQLISSLASESSSLWNRTNLPRGIVAVAVEARPRRIGAAFLLVRKSGGLLGAALTALHWLFDGGTGHDQYRRLN